jgi:predicted acetyltransferase
MGGTGGGRAPDGARRPAVLTAGAPSATTAAATGLAIEALLHVSASAYHPGMVSLTPATRNDEVTLGNLMQLYVHDWSELRPLEVGPDGRFQDYPLEAYFSDEEHHAHLIHLDQRLAGFALVVARSRLTGTAGVFDMAEFFVLRRHRRSGVGRAAAHAAFDRFAGPWEIRQRDENAAATAFWRRAISTYTGDRYQETRWDAPAWTGIVQRLSTVK